MDFDFIVTMIGGIFALLVFSDHDEGKIFSSAINKYNLTENAVYVLKIMMNTMKYLLTYVDNNCTSSYCCASLESDRTKIKNGYRCFNLTPQCLELLSK